MCKVNIGDSATRAIVHMSGKPKPPKRENACPKETPMKPVNASLYYSDNTARGMSSCPACKSLIYFTAREYYRRPKYCKECGQRLDWGNKEIKVDAEKDIDLDDVSTSDEDRWTIDPLAMKRPRTPKIRTETIGGGLYFYISILILALVLIVLVSIFIYEITH